MIIPISNHSIINLVCLRSCKNLLVPMKLSIFVAVPFREMLSVRLFFSVGSGSSLCWTQLETDRHPRVIPALTLVVFAIDLDPVEWATGNQWASSLTRACIVHNNFRRTSKKRSGSTAYLIRTYRTKFISIAIIVILLRDSCKPCIILSLVS